MQRAYEILTDPTLRRRYDAGHDVSKEDVKLKPMKFKVIEIDKERGKAKVWWYDPNTGEEGYMEQDWKKDTDTENERNRAATDRPLRDHCCLPDP